MRPLLRVVLLLVLACLVLDQSARANEVRFIYLVPSDRIEKASYREAVASAARHFQAWLSQTTDGLTFGLADPIVRVVRSNRLSIWFRSTDRHTGYIAFYRNAAEELSVLAVAKAGEQAVRYIVYVDADHACGQSGAGGNGLAILSANDLRGLAGEALIPACEKPNTAEIPGRCRWIGGMGHELLHALGLPHSDRYPTCQTALCRNTALMMHGYVAYPRAELLADEMAILRRSPFIRPHRVAPPANCVG